MQWGACFQHGGKAAEQEHCRSPQRIGLQAFRPQGRRGRVHYGVRKDAPEPVYDLAKLPLTVPPDQLPQAILARARALPLAPPPPPPWSETHRGLFWAILIGVVVLLLLVIVKAMRRTGVQTQ